MTYIPSETMAFLNENRWFFADCVFLYLDRRFYYPKIERVNKKPYGNDYPIASRSYKLNFC